MNTSRNSRCACNLTMQRDSPGIRGRGCFVRCGLWILMAIEPGFLTHRTKCMPGEIRGRMCGSGGSSPTGKGSPSALAGQGKSYGCDPSHPEREDAPGLQRAGACSGAQLRIGQLHAWPSLLTVWFSLYWPNSVQRFSETTRHAVLPSRPPPARFENSPDRQVGLPLPPKPRLVRVLERRR